MVLFVFVFSVVHLSYYLMAHTAGFSEYSTEKSIQNVLLRGMRIFGFRQSPMILFLS